MMSKFQNYRHVLLREATEVLNITAFFQLLKVLLGEQDGSEGRAWQPEFDP